MEEKRSYFEIRMQELGITPEMHLVNNYVYGNYKPGEEGFQLLSFQIFQPDKDGNIDVFYPTLQGLRMQFKQGSEETGDNKTSRWSQYYSIKRLAQPKDGRKYLLKRGSGTRPFLPPAIIEKYQKGEKIKNLFFTEGSIKAFVSSTKGIDIIGFTSITHLSDSIFSELHQEVKDIIQRCSVERCVWLVDGDCNRLSSKPINEIEDLYKRPNLFFRSGANFKQLLDNYENVEKYFCHPLSDELPGNPKGIDDLLISQPEKSEDIINDLQRFDKRAGYEYFKKINITFGTSELLRYFHLNNTLDFYLFHAEQRSKLKKNLPELDELEGKDFTFNGTRYRYNPEKKDLEVITPGDAKRYFRVGDQYHELFQIPNKYGENDNVFHRRQKSTIIDDNGPNFIKHIPKYKAFCVVPDHSNFQQVINSCFNIYNPFEHTPEEGECENTMAFLKHIFGDKKIKYKHFRTNHEMEADELELGLDYLQLLYQYPTQKLPILCLVSKENETGKSTFAFWLRALFTQNVAIVGNAELADSFNASWASKLLIICDEAKIDKQVVVEKVKSLSTAEKIFMNAKGKDHIEIDFFGKFIFLTNNEENFIYASEEDRRYWIRKVPKLQDNNPNLLKLLKDEIPAFLDKLNKRKLSTAYESRSHFDPNVIKTDALKKVIAYSVPTIEKEIRSHLRDMFLDFPDLTIIEMAKKDIKEEFFKHKNYEMNYLQTVIEERLRVSTYCTYQYQEREFATVAQLLAAHPEANPEQCKKNSVKRYKYYKWEDRLGDGGRRERIRVEINGIGRPFVFKAEDFLTTGELKSRGLLDPELLSIYGGGHLSNAEITLNSKQADLF